MEELLQTLSSLHTAEGLRNLVQTGGLLALTIIVFAETGLLIGFFLPGDSLLITAGIFAASDGLGGEGIFNIWVLTGVLAAAAIIGDQVGYMLGRKTGPLIFSRNDSFLFKKKHVQAAHDFYEKHGAKALIFARFVPIFRTFVPFVAGVAQMSYSKFVRFNIIGGILWIYGLCFVGYKIGQSPLADQLHKIIIIVIFVSILPIIISAAKGFLSRKKTVAE